MNILIVIGRITKELELRYTKDNKTVCELNVAINNGKDDTTFLPITTFGKTAELINKYCQKGDMLSFQCIVKNHNWEDKENVKHYDYSFIANKINFLSKTSKSSSEQQKPLNGAKNNEIDDIFEDFAKEIELTGDELPF